MREILFRGKRKDNGEWVEGRLLTDDLIVPCGQDFILESNCIYECDKPIICYEVYEETVGQFTGLTDKNGKKIFEGDIVRYYDDENYYPEECLEFFGEICFEKGSFGIGSIENIPLTLEEGCNNDNFVSLWEIYWNLNCCENELPMLEVIGNIHDNPELLEEWKR